MINNENSLQTPSHGELREGEEAPPPGVRAMAVVRWVLIVVMGLVAVGSVSWFFGSRLPQGASANGAEAHELWQCPMHPQIIQDHPGECPICGMTLVKVQKRAGVPAPATTPTTGAATEHADAAPSGKYQCPMHPQITSDDPNARCSICGMKLEPVPQAAGPAPSPDVPGLVPINLPLDRVQRIGVRTAKVTKQALGEGLRTVGVVQANERGLAQITTRYSGWIEDLAVAETGQRVRRGQTLATVYSPEVLQAQQELVTALGWAGEAPVGGHEQHGTTTGSLVADARRRLELLGIAKGELDELVRTRKVERALPLRSPVDGYVINKNAVVGMTVAPGTPLFEVADLSTVWVIAEVYEAELGRVRIGQPARFEVAAFPGETFAGKVTFVYPTLDAASRTLRVRLELRNRPGPAGLMLRPGLFGNVMLDVPARQGVTVPAEAVVDTGELRYVFVAKAGGRFEPRAVKVGARTGERLEVLDGLLEGEEVVTTASFLIDSESRLRAAIEGRAAAPTGEAPPAGHVGH